MFRADLADDMPRERLLNLGAEALTDTELVAVVLGRGTREWPVQRLAGELMTCFGGLKGLLQRAVDELCQQEGLGPARTATLLAAAELGKRIQRSKEKRPRLRTPEELHGHLGPRLNALPREVFHVLSLNARGVLIRDVRVALGSVNHCPVDPREVFASALAARATAIILAHNHPSGDPHPSREDIELTEQLWQGGLFLGIRVLDHLIIGEGQAYFSLAAHRLMPEDRPCRRRGAACDPL